MEGKGRESMAFRCGQKKTKISDLLGEIVRLKIGGRINKILLPK